jgi:hypothetical protein
MKKWTRWLLRAAQVFAVAKSAEGVVLGALEILKGLKGL